MRALAVCAAAAAVSCSGSCSAEESKKIDPERAPESVTSELEAEFDGAYPAEAPAPVAVREFALRAAPATLPLLEGRALRVWAYNGQVPGPTLRVRKNQKLRVTFRNDLPEPSTVHWHGVRVPNAMDGVPHVTQPPVPPGGSFVYEFVPKDAGTFSRMTRRCPTRASSFGCSTTGGSTSAVRSTSTSTRATTSRTTGAGATSSP